MENDEIGKEAINLSASIDFAEFTPHMLVCESPGHCRQSQISQTVEDSIRAAHVAKGVNSVKSERGSLLGSIRQSLRAKNKTEK